LTHHDRWYLALSFHGSSPQLFVRALSQNSILDKEKVLAFPLSDGMVWAVAGHLATSILGQLDRIDIASRSQD
jgi:hypothetical protein